MIIAQQINIIEIVEKYKICPHFLNGIIFGTADKIKGKRIIK
jgi:hypothetical protein